MYINDDADGETVFGETLSALKECARHIGKVGVLLRTEQIDELEAALKQLQNMLDLKKRMKNA